jgi:hypothetical protein
MMLHSPKAHLVVPRLWTPPTSRKLGDWLRYLARGERGATGTAFSDYLEEKVLEHVFGSVDYTPPTSFAFALYTAAPSDAGGGTKVTGGSYADATDGNDTTLWPSYSGGSIATGVAVDFGTATADWGIVTHLGIEDQSANLLVWGALDSSRDVKSGDSFQFAAGDITVGLD